MKNKRIFAALSAVTLLLTACGSNSQPVSEAEASSAETTAPAEVEKTMVTLGDSISAGYGLEDPLTQSYSVLLAEKLNARDNPDHITWKDYNYALSGDNSTDLLRNLQNGRAMRLPSSDTIVLCIGANNLLGVYTDYAMEKAEEFEIDIENVTEEDLEGIREKLEQETEDQEKLQAEFQSRIDKNLETLKTDLESIYDWIKERNQKADIYVLNVYNPYTPDANSGILDDSAQFYDFAVTNLKRLNTIISDFTAAHDDLIFVDIASAFAKCENLPVIGNTAFEAGGENAASYEYYDPHPTAEGQQLIAETVWSVMESHQ